MRDKKRTTFFSSLAVTATLMLSFPAAAHLTSGLAYAATPAREEMNTRTEDASVQQDTAYTEKAVLLQKWLLAVSGISLDNQENADLNQDGVLNGFDLCLMKQERLAPAKADALVLAEQYTSAPDYTVFSTDELDRNGERTAMAIKAAAYAESFLSYEFTGGAPDQFYEIGVWVKTEDFECADANANAVAIQVTSNSDYNRHWIFSNQLCAQNSVSDENGYVFLSRVVKLDREGAINFNLRTSWYDNNTRGTVYVDDVSVVPVSEVNTYTLRQSTDGSVRMVFRCSDIKITDELLQQWLDTLATFRQSIKWLVGGLEYTPTTDYICTEQFDYYGLAGNPVYINCDYMERDLQRINFTLNENNNMLWGFIHEMGHTFDFLESNDGFFSCRWDFDGEFFGTLKGVYALQVAGYGMGDSPYLGENIWEHFRQSGQQLSNGTYSNDGLMYRLMQIIGTTDDGWNALHETFVAFDEMSSTEIPYTRYDKFTVFIDILSQKSGIDIPSQFSEAEWTLLTEQFAF